MIKKTIILLALAFVFALPVLADDGGDRVKTSDKHQLVAVETDNKVREMSFADWTINFFESIFSKN